MVCNSSRRVGDGFPVPILHQKLSNWQIVIKVIGFRKHCITYRRGSAHSFPRGEAVAQIGTSEPIWVTDEERRNVKYSYALRENG